MGAPRMTSLLTDSVIGADFQGLSAEEQERQREEWKAELRSEAPTGHHPVEGVQRGHDPGPEKPAGERHIQENSGKSSICKGHCKREECGADRRHIGFLHIPESEWKCIFCLWSCQEPDVRLCQSTDVRRGPEGAQRQCGRQ